MFYSADTMGKKDKSDRGKIDGDASLYKCMNSINTVWWTNTRCAFIDVYHV